MNLLDRYIHEVGRYLPRKERGDIQAELRSSLVDNLEDRYGPDANDEQVAELLGEFGKPADVAASYHPRGQYLVGPDLYPFFRMVALIVIAAVLGAQLLAWGVAGFIAGEGFSPLEMLASLINSIPASLGWVVIVFLILQYTGARPQLEDKEWDPRDLPDVNPELVLKRGELVFGLVFGTLVLVLVTAFPEWIGFVTFPGGRFFPNPVILDNLLLIQISLLASILFSIYMLRKGSWDGITRAIKLGLNLFSIVILVLLVQGHNSWLAAQGGVGVFAALESLTGIADAGWELVGMHAFRLAFVVALIVTAIESVAMLYSYIKELLAPAVAPSVENRVSS